jgi:hypothetical protein
MEDAARHEVACDDMAVDEAVGADSDLEVAGCQAAE